MLNSSELAMRYRRLVTTSNRAVRLNCSDYPYTLDEFVLEGTDDDGDATDVFDVRIVVNNGPTRGSRWYKLKCDFALPGAREFLQIRHETSFLWNILPVFHQLRDLAVAFAVWDQPFQLAEFMTSYCESVSTFDFAEDDDGYLPQESEANYDYDEWN